MADRTDNPLESSADRAEFVEVFGTDVVIDGVSLKAIFDYAYVETLDVAAREPMLTLPMEDVTGVAYGSTVIIPEVSFSGSVKGVEPDGTGFVTLMLRNG